MVPGFVTNREKLNSEELWKINTEYAYRKKAKQNLSSKRAFTNTE